MILCGSLKIFLTPEILKSSLIKVFHINVCFLNKNIDDLEYSISSTNITYDIVAMSETRIMRNLETNKNINTKNYNMEYMSVESTAGGTMLYIANHLTHKPRLNLNIYKINLFE